MMSAIALPSWTSWRPPETVRSRSFSALGFTVRVNVSTADAPPTSAGLVACIRIVKVPAFVGVPVNVLVAESYVKPYSAIRALISDSSTKPYGVFIVTLERLLWVTTAGVIASPTVTVCSLLEISIATGDSVTLITTSPVASSLPYKFS